MEITWQAHHAVISDRLRRKAALALDKVEQRMQRAVRATVRFEREETRCHVEIVVAASRLTPLVAVGHGRFYGPALSMALEHLMRQVSAHKRTVKERAARATRR